MSVIIRAHFDGKTIVPDAKVDLPAGQPLEVELRLVASDENKAAADRTHPASSICVTKLPFFGMWADREDMADSGQWVRKEREKWSSRLTDKD